MEVNLTKLKTLLKQEETDGILLTHLPDILWVSGFSGSNGILLVTHEGAHLVTDGRYKTQAEEETAGVTIHVPGYALYEYLQTSGLLSGLASISVQAETLSVQQHEQNRTLFPAVAFQPLQTSVATLVAVKTAQEIECIQKAQAITDEVFATMLRFICAGRTEKEVAAQIVYRHLSLGADKMSFDPIVATGPHGALPHARPSERVLQEGDMVVLDFGCFLDGYASDMTRTVAIGQPADHTIEVYHVVLEAQEKALQATKAGIQTDTLDGVARSHIESCGYGAYFSHSLGHGIGLQVHEWPTLSTRFQVPLPEKSVVTIEPGIYIPGAFGIRIEDLIVVEKGGHSNLTRSPKDLISL